MLMTQMCQMLLAHGQNAHADDTGINLTMLNGRQDNHRKDSREDSPGEELIRVLGRRQDNHREDRGEDSPGDQGLRVLDRRQDSRREDMGEDGPREEIRREVSNREDSRDVAGRRDVDEPFAPSAVGRKSVAQCTEELLAQLRKPKPKRKGESRVSYSAQDVGQFENNVIFFGGQPCEKLG